MGNFTLISLSGSSERSTSQRRLTGHSDARVGYRSLRFFTWISVSRARDDTRRTTRLPAVRTDPRETGVLAELCSAQLTFYQLLHGKYRGAVAQQGKSDRFEAILVKDQRATFTPVPAGSRYALAAVFRSRPELPEIVLLSAHADAFNAARRRAYTEALMDWSRPENSRQRFL